MSLELEWFSIKMQAVIFVLFDGLRLESGCSSL